MTQITIVDQSEVTEAAVATGKDRTTGEWVAQLYFNEEQ